MSKDDKIEELTYEQAFKMLEEIVLNLESGNNTLEESINMYERGQVLLNHCTQLLETAELKIQQLSGNELIPFDN